MINISSENYQKKMLIEAGQPEILRAAQRDDNFKKKFSENASDIYQSLFGIHLWIKHKESVEKLSKMFYQVLTTMSNLQTLGEEYTGIIQVEPSKKSLPSKYLQFLMILIKNFGEKVLIDALQKFEKSIENLPEDHHLKHSTQVKLIELTNAIKICFPFISKFHKAIFYFNGHYYDIANRMCGIKYVLVRHWLKNRSSLFAFKLMGILTVIQSILSLLFIISNHSNTSNEKVFESEVFSKSADIYDKCSLCLNIRQHTSVTPCGHLFCWSCIISWLQEQSKCPLCRQVFQPSRVVFLQNYSNCS